MEGSVLRDEHGIQKGVFAVLFSDAGDPEIPIFDFGEDIHCGKQSHDTNKFVRMTYPLCLSSQYLLSQI